MSATSVTTRPSIVWDDSVVFIFSFDHNGTTWYGGFVHLGYQYQQTVGSSTQVTTILQNTTQQGVQFSSDPQTWLDTVKSSSRSSGQNIVITYDDTINYSYTTQTGYTFQLQVLYSLAG